MTGSDSDDAPAGFVDVGTPLSPAEAGMLEFELERLGVATRLRLCGRGPEGDRQAVQVAPGDLETALSVRSDILRPEEAAPEARSGAEGRTAARRRMT